MSDPILEEEDDLISQDDIDKLLDISPEDEDAGEEEAGELSQDDIDSLLNGPDPDEADSDAGEEEAGELSQDDIDNLMTDDTPDDEDSSEADEAGELSQDDIDSLLNGPDPNEADSDAEEEEAGELSQDDIDSLMTDNASDDEDSAEADEADELSQDDIDGLLNGPDPDDDDDEFISLEDIQGAMNGELQENEASDSEPDALEAESNQGDGAEQTMEDDSVDDGPGIDGAPEMVASDQGDDPLDEPIDEDQAADVADCMLTQEAMDALIEAGLPGPEVVEADAADGEDDNPLDEEDQAPATDSDGADDTVQEDDVTQEDIDALLQQSDEQDELLDEDEDILISQDDINTLLMAADQEDEDVLGDIDGEDDTSDLEDELDDLVSDSDQVVLEGIEGAEISDGKESSKRGSSKSEKIKALLKSKIVLAAASVLLFMGISIPLSYFLFFSSEPAAPLPEKQTASLTEIDLIRDGQTDGSGNMPALPPSRRSGTVLLTDFIILASDQSRTMTYVYADVSIDYSDQRAYDEINSNLAFYRDVIYGAIQTRLVSEKNNEVTEADLLWGVEASLKKVLPPQYIDKISFKSFKAT
jgi:pilus assembly protein FimV